MVHSKQDDDGFTLIEVLSALAVIGIVLTATTALFVRSMTIVNAQGTRQAALQIATDSLESLRAVSGTQAQTWLAEHGAVESLTVNTVPFQRSWSVDTGTAGLLAVTITVTWPERGCPDAGCTYRTTTLISTAAAEPVFEVAMIGRIARRLRPPAGDGGFSLIEVMVSAGIMSVVTAIAAGGFVTMYHTFDKTDAAAQAQTSLLSTFNKLDHEIRYAMRITNEGSTTSTLWSVTYVIPDGDNNKTCVQLTLPKAGGLLLRRQWTRPDVLTAPTATFTTVAGDLVSTGGALATPFAVVSGSTDTTKPFDTMELKVTSTVGVGLRAASKTYDITFTAQNTSSGSINLKCLP